MMQLNRVVYFVVIVLTGSRLGVNSQGHRIIFRNEENLNGATESPTDNGCNIPHGGRGKCIKILECPALLALIGKPEKFEYLMQLRCGWNLDCPLVCCENESSKIEKHNCTASELHWCESGKFDECCIPELPYNINEIAASNAVQVTSNGSCVMSSIPPEPSSGCCGQQSTILKIIPGEVTLMDQYPWTALIEYAGTLNTQIKCGGALISGRYVLTAAHCLYLDYWTPTNIRLGDYDIGHDGRDCIRAEDGNEECTDGEVTISIEKTIPHPDYNIQSQAQTNDIALIRMKYNSPYTDFIRPICLPSELSDFTESAENSTKLQVVGWGVRYDGPSRSQLKRQVKLPLVSAEDCFMVYRRLSVLLGDGQICAGSDKTKDSCKGDSGGALMLVKNQRTEIVGIASFSSCGRANRPAVFTKVFHYLPWIKSIIN